MKDTYCPLPWNNFVIRSNRKITPCCRVATDKITWPLWPPSSQLKKIFNHSSFTNIRKAMIENKRYEGCQKCYDEEKAGMPSLRTRSISANDVKYTSPIGDPSQVTSYEVFLGNTCNLKCVICGLTHSSKWQEDSEALGIISLSKHFLSEPNYEKLNEAISPKIVKFVGGEPFLTPEHSKIIKMLLDKKPENIILTYSTNATIQPTKSLLNAWKKFRWVNISLSIDGIGKCAEYTRFPCKWTEVNNVAQFYLKLSSEEDNIFIYGNSSVSAYNIFDLNNIESWWKKSIALYPDSQVVSLMLQPITHPSFLTLRALTHDLRLQARNNLDENSEAQRGIMKYLDNIKNESSINLEKKFVERTTALDNLRGISVLDSIAELNPMFS